MVQCVTALDVFWENLMALVWKLPWTHLPLSTVFLKQVPLGSLEDDFLIPRGNFFQGGTDDEKLWMEKPLVFIIY